VLPIQVESHNFVWEQRLEQYEDLLRALQVLRLCDAWETDKSETFVMMWLLETRQMNDNVVLQVCIIKCIKSFNILCITLDRFIKKFALLMKNEILIQDLARSCKILSRFFSRVCTVKIYRVDHEHTQILNYSLYHQ
jgi:hypothetical protein